MKDWLAVLTQKKKQLDQLQPLSKELVKNLDDWLRIELTYTSNAIEGNTLSRQETALIVEKGLTVSGKTLIEHQEAINHAAAWGLVKELARSGAKITASDILGIHRLILNKIDDQNAGHYRSASVRISGSTVILPNPLKVPELMAKFISGLKKGKDHPLKLAVDAHYQLVSIHPFTDGNGRAARLLMNLILLKAGYPAAIIRKEDRLKYLNSLETAQLGGSKENYYELIYAAVDRSFAFYLPNVKNKSVRVEKSKLLKIGELAKLCGETVATIRFWTTSGLLTVTGHTKGGYQLYHQSMVDRVRIIRKQQTEKRLTIKEINQKLN
ncbi:MAG: Fic family protein [Patescibacteria group bacterium]|nr:Fic family protein [Patescibacteria group bacterium]